MGTGQCFKVYQASAGSGKTFTIVKEYLELCLKSQEHVGNFRRILAITFTNASANDMKVKVLNHINGIINSPVGHPTDMEQMLLEDLGISDDELKTNAKLLLTSILHDYSSFCISTIDAFVQKLSRTFAIWAFPVNIPLVSIPMRWLKPSAIILVFRWVMTTLS